MKTCVVANLECALGVCESTLEASSSERHVVVVMSAFVGKKIDRLHSGYPDCPVGLNNVRILGRRHLNDECVLQSFLRSYRDRHSSPSAKAEAREAVGCRFVVEVRREGHRRVLPLCLHPRNRTSCRCWVEMAAPQRADWETWQLNWFLDEQRSEEEEEEECLQVMGIRKGCHLQGPPFETVEGWKRNLHYSR